MFQNNQAQLENSWILFTHWPVRRNNEMSETQCPDTEHLYGRF